MRRKDVLAVVAAAASTLLVAGVVWFGQHSGVERYRPVPAIPGAVRPTRAVLLYVTGP